MTVLYLDSDQMGRGDAELGRKLLKSFLKELLASPYTPDLVGCLNHGVRLTTTGSPVLEELRALEAKGSRVASCGTCLDAFDLRDQLEVGEVGNMAMTVEILNTAQRVIRI